MAVVGRKPIRILIADDARSMRSLIRSAFPFLQRPLDYHDVDNGLDALTAYRSRRFDIAVIDIVMPDMDGLSVLEAIKAYDEDCFVVVITGDPDPALGEEARALGARDFVRKPISQQVGKRIFEMFDGERRPTSLLVIDKTDNGPLTLKFGLDALNFPHRMYRAVNAAEALGTLDKIYFDIVFIATDLSDPDDLALLQRVKRIRPYVYTVMFSDQCTAEAVKLATSNGADDYLLRTISLEHLRRMLTRFRNR